MPAFALVDTQLIPPRIKNPVRRQRLISIGQNILSHRVTTVIAPAGFGKSVWVSSLLEEPGWPLTAWLSLDSHDLEPSVLLYHLIHAVKMMLPGFGDESLRTVNSLESAVREWSIAVNTFIEELPRQQELVLVIDDFHLIHENKIAAAIIERLLRWLPGNLHVILISRVSPRLNLYRQQFSGELLEINSQHLLFSLEETSELLTLMDLELSIKDVELIHNRTEGWAVGLRLVGMFIKQPDRDIEKTIQGLMREGSSLGKYLVNELLGSLPERLRDFLLDSSLLPYLEVGLCSTALKCNDISSNIETLHAYGLLSRVEGSPVTWQMHHLISDYLKKMLITLRTPDFIADIRQQAGDYFEKKGNIDQAIEQAVACSDWKRASFLIHQYACEYFMMNTRQETLIQWIDQLPEKMSQEDQWLLYFKGKSLIQNDDKNAVKLLTASADIASQKGDIKCEVSCLVALLTSYFSTSDKEKGDNIRLRLINIPGLDKDVFASGAAMVLALTHTSSNDDLMKGLSLSNKVLQLNLNPELRMYTLYGSAILHNRIGNQEFARQLVEEALGIPLVQANERLMIMGLAVLTAIYNLIGERKVLEEACNKSIKLTRKYKMLIQEGRAHRQLGRMYYREGLFTEAQKEHEITYGLFAEADSVSLTNFAALELLPLRIKNGENAVDLLEETRKLVEILEKNPGGQGIDHYIYSVAGIVALEAGKLQQSKEWFEKSAMHWRRNEAKQNLAGTNLLLAHVNLIQGKEKEADSLLRKSLSAAEAGHWDNFWEWHDETIYTMCRRALLKNIRPGWAAHILHRWFPQRSRRELGHLLISSDERLRTFASLLIGELCQEAGTTIIHVFYLGEFRVFINGIEISNQEWQTQKAENLFKFLAANRRKHIKEEIIEQLWPESDPCSGDSNLRMSLSRIRKAIKHDSLESVILQRGQVYLNPKIEVYTDFELFSSETEKAMQYFEDGSPYAVNALEQAADLYRGTFLPENVYNDWTNITRTNLQILYLQAIIKLAEAHYHKKNYSSALKYCRQCLALEPDDEPVTRLMMQILWETGQKRKAGSIYNELCATLESKYHSLPEDETTNLYQKMKTNQR